MSLIRCVWTAVGRFEGLLLLKEWVREAYLLSGLGCIEVPRLGKAAMPLNAVG